MKKLKEGQTVVYQGKKYEFIKYDPTSATGMEQRAILKKGDVDLVYVVLVRELN